MQEYKSKLTPDAPFGVCPFCGCSLGWSSDEPWIDDENITVRYLTCSNCGASVEALECPCECRCEYPYWNGSE